MAIFLQKDGSAETYDFLELYIRRWQREERRVLRNCSRRNLESYNEEEEFEDEDSLEEGRRLGQMLRREYFNREWHPYDWVTKAGTEVGIAVAMVCLLGPSLISGLPFPSLS